MTTPTSPDRAEVSDRAELAAEFRYFAARRAGTYAPLYAHLAEAFAAQPDMLRLAALARPGQSRPDLLFAVIHDLLLSDPHAPAARFYPSITEHPDTSDPGPDVVSFALSHVEAIAAAMASRLVQTNEIGRCAFLLPAVQYAAQAVNHGPVALLEVGASAGLNLLLDHYGYNYRAEHEAQPCLTVAGNPVLSCVLTAEIPAVTPALAIAWRAGIDLHPLDVSDLHDRRWLRALVWPNHHERAAQLQAALRMADQQPHRPTIYEGDAAQRLTEVVALAPADAHLVIYHSAVLAHMTPAHRQRFTDAVLACSRHRDLSWIQAEPRPDNDPRRLRLTQCSDGQITAEHALGSYQPHGHWLRWQARSYSG